MTQKTIIIIILAAILSAVGIIASIQLSRHHEEQKIKAEIQKTKEKNAAYWKKQCKEIEKRGLIKFKGGYKCDE